MTEREIGVGPHPSPWPTGERYDPELLQNGDRRNVEDKYRYWTVAAITHDLDATRHEVEVAIENWQHDLNIGTIVRNANAFNARKVHVIGKHHWNRRGAMVTDRYMHIEQHATVAEFVAATRGLAHIAVDNVAGSVPLGKVSLPRRAVLVFGGEGPGLSDEMRAACQATVAIEQFGSTRSVNVGVASGIVLYAWVQRHVLGHGVNVRQ